MIMLDDKHTVTCSYFLECGWWFSSPDDSYDPLAPTELCKGFEDSLELIKKTFKEQVRFFLYFE